MTPQEQLIQLAKEIKSKSNTRLDDKSPEWIMGRAMTEPLCYYRGGDYRKAIFVTRKDKTIIVTEKTIGETHKVVDNRMIFEPFETSEVILTIDL